MSATTTTAITISPISNVLRSIGASSSRDPSVAGTPVSHEYLFSGNHRLELTVMRVYRHCAQNCTWMSILDQQSRVIIHESANF